MIEFRNVTKNFGSNPILNNVNFTIEKGGLVYLVGKTGSGKTTIFRLIIRDLIPSEGEVILGDWDVGKLTRKKIPELRRRIGVIFQDYKLLHDRTVFENVLLPLEIAGVPTKEAKVRAQEVLSEVGLAENLEKFPLQLSGGENQRVAIARALVFNPEIIIADEPTGNLDQNTSFQIINLLKNINQNSGTTMFIATHNEKVVDETDERVFTINEGVVTENKKQTKEDKK